MKKLLFIIALALTSISVSAHNPNTASVVISPINGVWIAQFTISQEGANYALNSYYADKDLTSIEAEKYKELYISYLKKKISLIVDDTKISFSSAGIKLGNHQTDIKLLLPDFPENYRKVELSLPMFEENEQQHTVVRFLENEKSIRKVLNQANEFKMNFENINTEFKSVNANKLEFNKIIYGIIALIIIAIGVYFYRIRNKTVANN